MSGVVSGEIATESNRGIVTLASPQQTIDGAIANLATTPFGVKAATDALNTLPDGGTPGQVVTKGSGEVSTWADPPQPDDGGLASVATDESLGGLGTTDAPLGVEPDFHNSDVTDETPRDLKRYGDGAVIFNRGGTTRAKDASFIDVISDIGRSDPEFRIDSATTFSNTFIGANAVTGFGLFIRDSDGEIFGGTPLTDPFPAAFQRFFFYEEQGQGRVMVFTNIASDNDLRANRLVLTVNGVVLGEWGVSRHNEPINGWNIFDTYLQHSLFDAVNNTNTVKVELHVNHDYMFQAATITREIRSLKEVVRHDLRSLDGTPADYGERGEALLVNATGDGMEYENIQGDWNESDSTDPNYIHNKPHIIRQDVQAADHLDVGTYVTDTLANNHLNINAKQTPDELIMDMEDDDYLSFFFQIDSDEASDDSTRGSTMFRVGDVKAMADGQTILGSGSLENYKRLGTVLSEGDGGAFRFFIVPGRTADDPNLPIEFWYGASPALATNLPVRITITKLPFSLIGAALESRQHIYDTEQVGDIAVNITEDNRFFVTDLAIPENDWWLVSFGKTSSGNVVPQLTYYKLRTAELRAITGTSQGNTQVGFSNSIYVEHHGTEYFLGRTAANNLTVATSHSSGTHDIYNLKIFREITATAKAGTPGEGIEVIYYQVISGQPIPTPDNSWGYGEPVGGWLSAFPGVSEARPLVLRAERVKVGGEWLDWSAGLEFAIWTRDGTDGTDGTDGDDGTPGTAGIPGIQGIAGSGDFAALALTQLGSENVVAPAPNQFTSTSITIPNTSEWLLINFGADDVGTQLLANNYWVRATSLLALNARSIGNGVTGSNNAIEIEGSNAIGRRAFLGRTSANVLLMGFSAAQGGLSALPLTVYEVEVADAYSAGDGVAISADKVISSRVVGLTGLSSSAVSGGHAVSLVEANAANLGGVKRANTAEALAGTGDGVLTPLQVRAVIAQDVPDGTTQNKGRLQLATAVEVNAGSNTSKAVTPAGVNASIQSSLGGFDTQFNAKNIQDLANVPALVSGRVLTAKANGQTAWETAAASSVPDASVTTKGKIEIATGTEVTEGLDTQRAVTPQGLNARLNVRGIPVGGSHGQLLAKNGSNNNYNTHWIDGGVQQLTITTGSLNDYITTGYYVVSTGAAGKPSDASGALRVMRSSNLSNYHRQEFWEYNSGTYWSRATTNGGSSWTGWAEQSGAGGGGSGLDQAAVSALIAAAPHFANLAGLIGANTPTNKYIQLVFADQNGSALGDFNVDLLPFFTDLYTAGDGLILTNGAFSLDADALNLVPAGGSDTQILTWSGAGYGWAAAPSGGGGGGLTTQQVQDLINAAGHATNLNAAYSTTTGLLTLTLTLDDGATRQQSVSIPRYTGGNGINLLGNQFSIETASENNLGGIVLASESEVLTGTDGSVAVTPLTLQAKIDAIPAAEGGGVTEDQVEDLIAQNKVTYLTGDLNMDDIVAPGQYAYSRGTNTLTNQPTTNAGTVNNLGFQVWAQDGDVTGDLRQYARTTVPSVASYIRVRRAGEWFDWRAVIYVPSGIGNIGDVLTRIGTSEYHVSWAAPDYSSVTYTAGDGLDITDNEFRLEAATESNRGGVFLSNSSYGSNPTRVVTEGRLNARTASEAQFGLTRYASSAQVNDGTETLRAVTPRGLELRTGTPTRAGLVRLASTTEVNDGSNTTRVVTPSTLSQRTATYIRAGLVELADDSEIAAGTSITKAVTPAGLQGALQDIDGNVYLAGQGLYLVGNTFNASTADESRLGIIRTATNAEITGGTETLSAVTPAGLQAKINLLPNEGQAYAPGIGIDIDTTFISLEQARTDNLGGAELATEAEVIAGTNEIKMITPATRAGAKERILLFDDNQPVFTNGNEVNLTTDIPDAPGMLFFITDHRETALCDAAIVRSGESIYFPGAGAAGTQGSVTLRIVGGQSSSFSIAANSTWNGSNTNLKIYFIPD